MQTTKINNDGQKFTWRYEMSLFKNPNIFLLTAKVLFWTVVGVGLFLILMTGIADGFSLEGLMFGFKLMLLMLGIFAVLLVLGFLLYAAIMGGKYIVDFTMDENGIVHEQVAEQAKKARNIGIATAAVGLLTKKPTTAGAGLMSMRNTSTTEFDHVRKVILMKRRSVIKLHGGGANEVYADGEDFDFVSDYIRGRVRPDVKWIVK